jgi:hypothetical protein
MDDRRAGERGNFPVCRQGGGERRSWQSPAGSAAIFTAYHGGSDVVL